jgi:hypothetical protein
LKQTLYTEKLRYNKFSNKAGYARTNFFHKKYEVSYYEPILFLEDKVICWSLFSQKWGTMVAYVNINQLVMKLLHIDPPAHALHEKNFIPRDNIVRFGFILNTLIHIWNFLYKHYFKMLKKFNIEMALQNTQTKISSLELCNDLFDFSWQQINLAVDKVRAHQVSHIRSKNQTIYINAQRKSFNDQMKIYQKDYDLIRVEYTIYDIAWGNNLCENILSRKRQMELYFNFSLDTFSYVHPPTLLQLSKTLSIDSSMIYFLMNQTQYSFSKDGIDQSLMKKLKKKGMIELDEKRGIYKRTETLQYFLIPIINDPLNSEHSFRIAKELEENDKYAQRCNIFWYQNKL